MGWYFYVLVKSMSNIYDILTPQLYETFKTAIEIGKWPDGRALTDKQKITCIEAIINYEHQHVKEEDRVGYVPKKQTACGTDAHENEAAQPLNWLKKD